ncbi:MAG: molybdopterin molybdenumtransferase MoeA, partial [Desulfuromonadales bacterium]|nr:molybdopterin molybdenumtransferase MoeA [Desulfuromonadales bacterium]
MTEALLDYEIAQQEILARVTPGSTETVALNNAPGRILAQDLVAQRDLPGYDNSAMDGFAIRSAEAAAGAELTIAGEVAAGTAEAVAVKPGTAVRIMTGAMIPEGADAVIPVEDVDVEGSRIRLHRPVEKGDHIRWRGEDLAQGSL